MHARKMRRRGGWTKIKDEIQRQNGGLLFGRKCAVFVTRESLQEYIVAVFFSVTPMTI
jgi:hypothetical protein